MSEKKSPSCKKDFTGVQCCNCIKTEQLMAMEERLAKYNFVVLSALSLFADFHIDVGPFV